MMEVKNVNIFCFIFFYFCNSSYGSPFDKVIDSACRTNPTWTICQTSPTKAKLKDDVIPSVADDTTISSSTSISTTEIEELFKNETETSLIGATSEASTNMSPEISAKDMVFQAASFLEHESLSEGPSEIASNSAENKIEVIKQHYCHTYISNFTTFCQGKERFRLPEILQTRLTTFCDSFKSTCYPMHSIPCTPDCDQRFHAHCTLNCKCNYMYPFVVKFCSPVSIHSLEEVCRSWFIKCAKIHSIND